MATFDTQMRPEVRDVLGRLKSRIRWYVLAEGLTLLVVLASVLFWISLSVDAVWFTATKYELARWFRVGYVVLAAAGLAAGLLYWIGLRLFRSLRSKALALVLERRFPDLNDRLVTSVELSDFVTGRESELTLHMLSRTVEEASAEARRLRVRDVFESRPLRWAAIGALVAVISTVGYGTAYPRDIKRWIDAFIHQKDVYWDRDTLLEVYVVDEGGDGGDRPFDRDQHYKHPRGGTLTLRIRVPERDANGKKLVVPGRVEVLYQFEGDDKTHSAIADKDQQYDRAFKITFSGVQDSMQFYVVGNDYKNREPYYVDLVDPPRVEKTELECDYPPYTGMNADQASRTLEVLGKQVAVPVETRFLLLVKTNKPLRSARLEYDRYVLEFGWFPRRTAGNTARPPGTEELEFRATLTAKGLPGVESGALAGCVGSAVAGSPVVRKREFVTVIPESAAKGFFWEETDETGPGLRLPFLISKRETAAARARLREDPEDTFRDPQTKRPLFPGLAHTLVMPPNADVRIYLQDENGIRSPDAEEFSIQGKVDTPPTIDAQRIDIGTAVTPNALIPIKGTVNDDHGVATVRLDYRTTVAAGHTTTEGQPWRPLPLPQEQQPQQDPDSRQWPTEFKLSAVRNGETVPYTMLDVAQIRVDVPTLPGQPAAIPREARAGDLLTITVFAGDADDLNGPHTTRSAQVFDFKIVTPDDLHSILYDKESQLRIRFEDIIREVEQQRQEFLLRRGTVTEWKLKKQQKPAAGKEDEYKRQLGNLALSIKLTARRGQAQLQKNHGETRDIESGFRQIRAELINNRLFTASNARRLDQFIIKELHDATKKEDGDYVLLDRVLGRYNLDVDEGRDPTRSLDEALDRTDALLARLKAALKEMRDLVRFQQAVQLLRGIIDDQQKVNQRTKDELLRKFLGKDKTEPQPPKKP